MHTGEHGGPRGPDADRSQAAAFAFDPTNPSNVQHPLPLREPGDNPADDATVRTVSDLVELTWNHDDP